MCGSWGGRFGLRAAYKQSALTYITWGGMMALRTPMMIAAAAATLMALAGPSANAADADVALVNDAASVAGCERLSEVKGSSAWGGVVTNMAYNRALAQLKARAAKAGGTHVLLLNVSSGHMGSNMLGVAYRCTASPPTEPSP